MSYRTIALSSHDQALTERVIAATVQEAWTEPHNTNAYATSVRSSPENARRMVYPVCVTTDVAAAYASAIAAGNPDPGGDEAVITDGMILASVQAKWPADAP